MKDRLMRSTDQATRDSLSHRESTALDVRQRVLQHVCLAATLVEDRSLPAQEFVHELRKEMKKSRAGLRLLSGAMGVDLKGLEEDCRGIGRGLSSLRDHDVVLELVVSLDVPLSRDSEQAAWRRFGDRLVQQRDRLLGDGLLSNSWRLATVERLDRVAHRLSEIDINETGPPAFHRVLERTQKAGRKALRRLQGDTCDEGFHRLRKRAKRELYQRRMLELSVDQPTDPRIGLVDPLCQALGHQQDLVTFTSLASAAGILSNPMQRHLHSLVQKCREENIALAAKTYF
jgi:CHAD domain-containing protein